MSEITLADLTSGAVDGTGVFDQLLLRVEKSLDREFKKNRINATDYSKVYTSALSDTLTQSLQFLLSKQASDKQADLLDAQARQVEQGILNDKVNNQLLTKQLDKADADINLVLEQLNYLIAQGVKLGQDGALVIQQTTNAIQEKLVMVAQESKIGDEAVLLKQKTQTEYAQVSDSVYDLRPGLNEGTSKNVEGVVEQENSLRNAQKEGFKRDAEQKMAKIMVDTWTVRQTTDGARSTF